MGANIELMTGMQRLVTAVQELSLARDLETIMRIVRTVARELTGADGATFVLRDNGNCFYADEDAIEPLWKGKRFPLEACVSGWAMMHGEPVRIPDIYADERVPADAYRPTFVKSLAMVPIRTAAPIGAIGTYWAVKRAISDDEIKLLQALADSTSIAMENVDLFTTLENRVAERTAQLEAANEELESFSYSVSHDLRAPIRSIDGFSKMLEEDLGEKVDDTAKRHLARIHAATGRMNSLIDDLLTMSRVTRADMRLTNVDVSAMARAVAEELTVAAPSRKVEFSIADGLSARADSSLLRSALDNLIGNAFKFTGKVASPKIEVGSADGAFFVRDNGAGFDPRHASKLFGAFQRLHSATEFPGTGVGLAIVQRIIHRHGGRIWAESKLKEGATFSFTLPAAITSP